MRKILMLLLGMLILIPCVRGSEYEHQLISADSLYERGNYREAIKAYADIAKKHGTSAAILYNMGNAFAKDDKYGNAMICYLRAQELQPSNADIRNNIAYIEMKVTDRNKAKLGNRKGNVEPDELSFIESVRQGIGAHTSASLWGGLAMGAFVLLLCGVVIYIFSRNVLLRKVSFFGSIIFMLMTILFNIFAYIARDYWAKDRRCVVVAYESHICTDIQSPESSALQPPLVAGTLLVLYDDAPKKEGWTKVRLNSSMSGWIRDADIDRP